MKNKFGETRKFHYLSRKLKVMKVKVSSSIDEKFLEKVKQANLKKLAAYKEKGYTKEQCYSKFAKVFVDKNY